MMVCVAFATAAAAVSYQEASAQSIENDQYYIGDDGTIHIVGEVRNNLDVPLIGTVIHATITYDDGQDTILTKEARSLVNIIMPNMRGPFDIIITGTDSDAYADSVQFKDMADEGRMSYVLNLEYDFGEPKNQVIDVTESSLVEDRYGNIVVTGTVTNRGDITANTISIVATIYDDTENVAAVARVHTEPDYLRAGESAFFVMPIPDKKHVSDASKYDLVAESEEYAAVPEFPIGTAIILIGTFAAYVTATRIIRIPTTSLISAADPK